MKAILTVCIGNICRSPLAQVALAREFPQLQIFSAGLSALIGCAADPLSQQIAIEHSLDLAQHRAQQITRPLCQQADLILVMEQSHKSLLEKQFPMVCGKVFRLGHYQSLDIADPYRKPRAVFDKTWTEITLGMADWVPRIRQIGA